MLGYSAIPWLTSLCVCMGVGTTTICGDFKTKNFPSFQVCKSGCTCKALEGLVWSVVKCEVCSLKQFEARFGRRLERKYLKHHVRSWKLVGLLDMTCKMLIIEHLIYLILNAWSDHEGSDATSNMRIRSATRSPGLPLSLGFHTLGPTDCSSSSLRQVHKSSNHATGVLPKKVAVFGLNSERLVGNFDQLCQLISSICMMFHLMFLYFGTYFLRFWIWQDMTGRQSCTERFGSSCATLNCEFKGDDTVDPGATRKYQTQNVKTCRSTNQNRNVDLGKFEFAWEAEARVAGWWATLQLWPPRGQPRARRTWHETKRTGQVSNPCITPATHLKRRANWLFLSWSPVTMLLLELFKLHPAAANSVLTQMSKLPGMRVGGRFRQLEPKLSQKLSPKLSQKLGQIGKQESATNTGTLVKTTRKLW